jgi:hypothetical protein
LRQSDAKQSLDFTSKKTVRDTRHDTRTITISRIGTDSTSVSHVAKQTSCIRENLVRGFTLDVANETDTASILFVLGVVKAYFGGQNISPVSVETKRVSIATSLALIMTRDDE